MKCKVIDTINKFDMLSGCSRVAVALSGGADSAALLSILNDLKQDMGFELLAAHVNHSIRGAQADSDERFVRDMCERFGVELYVHNADVPSIAAQSGEGLEECGRRIRYEFFASLGDDLAIATAHNADDRAETFLLNFTRGSSLRGLCSIPPIRGNIIRPLIGCTKAEILEYCRRHSIAFVTDETNFDIAYSRNRVRRRVVPQLREVNPAFDRSAMRCIELLNEDNELLEQLTQQLIDSAYADGTYDAAAVVAAHPALAKRAVSRITETETGITPDYDCVNRIFALLDSAGTAQISGQISARVRKGRLEFPKARQCAIQPVPLACAVTDFGSFSLGCAVVDAGELNNSQKSDSKVLDYYIDCDKILGQAIVRSRLPGDSLCLAGRGCTKQLRRLYNERGIAPELRDGLCVIADDGGVLIAEGFGVAQRCAVTGQTNKALHISIKRG